MSALCVRVLAVLVISLGLGGVSPARAWENPPERQARIESLLDSLGQARSPQVAGVLDARLWHVWLRAGEPTIDGWMREALAARRAGDFPAAIRLLDQVIDEAPGYAEGWNQRATTYYEMGEDKRSLADIAETLARQPRHYGALSGRALIAIRAGDAQAAIDSIEAARRIHPFVSIAELLPRLRQMRNLTVGRPI